MTTKTRERCRSRRRLTLAGLTALALMAAPAAAGAMVFHTTFGQATGAGRRPSRA